MAGIDDGTLQGGVFFQAKQFGSVLRGFGPPVPAAGVIGDLYLDVQTFFLYNKRSSVNEEDIDPWGHYLFFVPVTYQSTLKWFSASAPTDDIGIAGDYALAWGGYPNYGMQPSIYGPRGISGWVENGNGPGVVLDPAFAGFALPVGLLDEGTPVAYSVSTQLIVCGLADEFILAIPITANGGDPVGQQGLQSQPVSVAVTINPLYTAEDGHAL